MVMVAVDSPSTFQLCDMVSGRSTPALVIVRPESSSGSLIRTISHSF
jgi:hypothetical protein